jgi:general secretion pathway protein D
VLTLAALLSACAATDAPLVPPPLQLPPQPASAAASAATETVQTRITPLPVAPQAKPSAQAAGRDVAAAPALATGEPVSINLEQVTLGAFAQLVFGDMLKKNVNVDAQVASRKDLVTFRSGSAQTPAQLESAAKLLLKSYGVAVVDLGGLVRVVPDNANLGNLPEIRRGAALPETPLPLRPVFQLVELQAVQQTEVTLWLRTMFGDRVKVQEDLGRNAVLISGTPDNMQAALEAIRVLDQPVLRGVQSVSITPMFWSADDLARRLVEVLTAQGYAVQPLSQAAGGVRYPIVILPVTGLNSVFVFARGGEILEHIKEWARNLDKPNERGIGKNFFTYTVKYKDAATLANTLEQLLSRSRSPVATTPPAAGAAATPVVQRSGAVVVDATTNMLIFQTSQDEYSQIIGLLQTLDRPTKGALIEVTVAEMSTDDAAQLGVEWQWREQLNNGGVSAGGTVGGLGLGTAGFTFRLLDAVGGVRVVVNALASNNRATILSSPRVLARNGETATIQVGQEVPIVTSSQSTPVSGVTNSVVQTIQYRNTGVILKVKPAIHSSDQIDLDVSQEVSEAQNTTTGVSASPTFLTRKVDTRLTLRHGATVMLGGLIGGTTSSGATGVPLLKDVPVLGALFRNRTDGGTKRELVIFITAYVINDDRDAEAVTGAFRNMLGPWSETTQPGQPQPSAAEKQLQLLR